jgi:hypothetical protein
MISVTLTLRNAIQILQKSTNIAAFKEACLTTQEWDDLNTLKTILEVFYEPTIILQSQTYPTLSLVLLLVIKVRSYLNNILEDQIAWKKNVSYYKL